MSTTDIAQRLVQALGPDTVFTASEDIASTCSRRL